MIETKDITKMVAHILRRDKGVADTQIMHPTREWFIGLCASTVIVGIGTWFCFYLFVSYQSEMSKEVVIVESAVPYNASNVKTALELFVTKQEKFDAILGVSSSKQIVVPSPTATSTPVVIVPEEVEDIPELIIDPPPVFEDSTVPGEAVLAL